MLSMLVLTLAMVRPTVSTTAFPLADGSVMTVKRTSSGARQGRVWSCSGPQFSANDVWGAMKDIKYFSLGGWAISFADPSGKGSGTTSFNGIKLQYAEGDKVEISISCSKMTLSFHATNCADGKTFFSRGVRDPWDPPRSSQSFSFIFQPREGVSKVSFDVQATPSSSPAYSGWTGFAAWVFTPGAKAPDQSPDIRISDAMKTGGDVSFLHAGGDISGYERLFTNVPPCSGVAADGVSMLVVTATSGHPGSTTFTVGGAGGGLYPFNSGKSIYKSAGEASVTVQSRELPGGKYGAVAFYRPPSYFGRGPNHRKIQFTAHTNEGGDKTASIDLVRPPVVLVHGTYDNPSFCYEEHDSEDETSMNLAPQLRNLGYEVSCVDWAETNGDKDPSDFQTNKLTVWRNKDGIKDALAKMRYANIAVTQVDVICHSQGGVIARTYCRGFPFSISLPASHKHYTNPDHCQQNGELCWYHRADNNYQGDIHRLITISSTHRGSAVCNMFTALDQYPSDGVIQSLNKLATNVFLVGVDKAVTGITTGGFLNQVPDSLELQLIGPTPVPSHAIACVATDEDMKDVRINSRLGVTPGMGDYYGKLFLIWAGVPDDAKEYAFKRLTQKAQMRGVSNAQEFLDELHSRKLELSQKVIEQNVEDPMKLVNNPESKPALDKVIYQIRKIVFEGDENDCTVALHSSWGLLKAPYVTKCEHVLHGWAPRYRNVQNKVINLLVDDGSQFDPNGFPGYSGLQSQAATFATLIRPMGGENLAGGDTNVAGNTGSSSGAANGGTSTGTSGTGGNPSGGTVGGGSLEPGALAAPPISASTFSPLQTGGLVAFNGSQMTLTLGTGEDGMPQAFAKVPLQGDFDISYDYDLKQWPSDNSLKMLTLAFRNKPNDDSSQVEIRREEMNGQRSMIFTTDTSEPMKKPASDGAAGRIRIRRLSTRWIVYQWKDSAWEMVGNFAKGPDGPVYPGFVLSRFGQKQAASVAVRPSKKSGPKVAATETGITGTDQPDANVQSGTCELIDVTVDTIPGQNPNYWQHSDDGNGNWRAIVRVPSMTAVYTIRAPKEIKANGTSAIRIDFDLQPKPHERATCQASFPDSDFTRDPFDRELTGYAEPGQRVRNYKVWRLKPYYGGAPMPDTMKLYIWLGDGYHYTFRYRVVK